jgi:hypothetical protein
MFFFFALRCSPGLGESRRRLSASERTKGTIYVNVILTGHQPKMSLGLLIYARPVTF